MKTIQILFLSVISGAAFAGGYPHSPAALNDVKVTGGFWLPRIETNRLVTVKTDFRKCEETGRIANFEKAARREKGGFKGVPYFAWCHRGAGEMQTWFAESEEAVGGHRFEIRTR